MTGKDTIWTRDYVALLAMNFFNGMGQMLTNTLLPLYARDLGIAAAAVGFIAGSFGITALGLRPIAGPAYDSFPKKPLLILSYVIMTVSTLAYPLASTAEALLVLRMVNGIGIGCTGPLALAIASSAIPKGRLASGISIYMLTFSVAQAVGPAFGLWCKDVAGFHTTFFLAGGFLVVGCLLACMVDAHEPDEHPPYRIHPNRMFAKDAIWPTCIIFMLSTANSCTGTFMAIYGGLRDVAEIGLFFVVYALALTATRPLFGRIADTKGTTVVLVPAMLCFALSYLIVSFSDSLPMFLLAAVVAACGYGVAFPLVQTLMVHLVPNSQLGAGSNTIYAGVDLANLCGPVIGGSAIELLMPIVGSEVNAYANMWLVMIVFIVGALVTYLVGCRKFLAKGTTEPDE